MKTAINTMFIFRDNTEEFCICFSVSGIQSAISNHFKVFFRDMGKESFDEINSGDSFLDVFIIFMTIVMKSNRIPIIAVYSGGCDNGTSKVTTDIFDGCVRIAEVRFGINVETMFMVAVTFGFDLFKRRTDDRFYFVQECGAEGVTKESIVKVSDMTPETIITKATFRKKTVDMGIPFEVSAKGM